MGEYNYGQLLHGLVVGFAGHITTSMTGITARIKDGRLEVRVYFDKEPTPLDKEIAYMSVSEAQSQLAGFLDYHTDCIYMDRKLELADMLDFWFFLRYYGQYEGMMDE